MRWVAVLWLVASCGRLGFDPLAGGDDTVPATCDAAPEPNDSLASATPIAFDNEIGGRLCKDDRDVFAINLVAGEEVAITITPSGPGWPTLELVDADDKPRAVRTYESRLSGFADRAGMFYVRVAGLAPSAGTPYRLTVTKLAGRHIFMSPTGSDLNNGEFATPLRQFDPTLLSLSRGDTLVLLDGTYTLATSGQFQVDCATVSSGTATEPIRVVALTDRQAFVQSDGTEDAIRIGNGCAYWSLEGLRIGSQDNMNGTGGTSIDLDASSHMTIRRVLAAHNNRYANSHVIEVTDSSDILVEDTELYDFHRDGILFWGTTRATARRVFIGSRGTMDVSGGYPSTMPDKGDSAIGVSHAIDTRIENVISEGNGAESNAAGYDLDCTDTHYLGDVSLGNEYGFISSVETGGAQNTLRTRYENCVAIDSIYVGFYMRSNIDASCTGCTSIGSMGHGWDADQIPVQPRVSSSHCINCLAVSSAQAGFFIQQQSGGWSLQNANAFMNGTEFDPSMAPELTSPTQLDPQLGGCLVYQPANSPLRGAGASGGTIGGEVAYRYRDGLLTTMPLWDPVTGAFPCGAVVAGVNDDPATSCIGIHQRLHVGAANCPLPYPAL